MTDRIDPSIEHRPTLTDTFALATLVDQVRAGTDQHPAFGSLTTVQRRTIPIVVIGELTDVLPGFDRLVRAALLENVLATARGSGSDGPDPMSLTEGALTDLVARLEADVDQL